MKAECKARHQVELVGHNPDQNVDLESSADTQNEDLECSVDIQDDQNYSDESMMEIPAPQIIISDWKQFFGKNFENKVTLV